MFGKRNNKKDTKRPNGDARTAWMQEMGITIPDFEDPNFGAGNDDGDDDDSDLQAELERMENGGGSSSKARPKPNQKKPGRPTQDLQSFHQDVNKLLSDLDRPLNDDELSGDENELLDELKEMTGDMEDEPEEQPAVAAKPVQATAGTGIVAELEARLGMYKKAIEAAKASGEAAKIRRYDRQFKLIQELLQNARAGRPVDPNEIPPAIGAAAAPPPPSAQTASNPQPAPVRAPPASSLPTQPPAAPLQKAENPVVSEPPTSLPHSNGSNEAIEHLKALALQARRDGDNEKAKEYLIRMKNLQSGATQAASIPQPTPTISAQEETHHATASEDDNAPPPALPLIAPVPGTIMEALQQRYDELVKRHQEAVSKGESAKIRRMERMKNQYKEAIDETRKGRPYNYSELAELPGFAPIPVQQPKAQPLQPPAAASHPPPTAVPVVAPPQPKRPMPVPEVLPSSVKKPATDTVSERQAELKRLAIQAHQRGDKEAAKRYLLESKRLEQAGSSAESLPPPDMSPTSESSVEGFDTIRDDEFTRELSQSSREVIYRRLTDDLIEQIQLCARNQQIYAHMEGANNAIRAKEFQNFGQRSSQDLERLKQSSQQASKKPIFHYEKRQMHFIQFNNDLTDNDLEVTVIRGINLQVPTGYSPTALETYVIIEFPYPPETPPQARTRQALGSANVEYNDVPHKFPIKRNDTKLRRLMGRKDLKLSIFYRAGFLRADRLLGVAFVKLAPLEEYATIHESVDVYENDHRKKPQGKLEVKIRIRDGLGPNKASEPSPKRWLIIDRFEDTSANGRASPVTSISTSSSPSIAALAHFIPSTEALGLLALHLARTNTNIDDIVDSSKRTNIPEHVNDSRRNSQQQTGPQSIQVLKYEAELLAEQIERLEEHLSEDQIGQLRTKQQALKDQSEKIIENLRLGGKQALQEHVRGLEQLLERYNREEEEFRQRNESKKADLSLEKKNCVAKEIDTFTSPL